MIGHHLKGSESRACVAVLLIVFLGGCVTSSSDMVSTTHAEGEIYSADEVRQVTVDQPFLLSGDYFRERNQESKSVGKILGLTSKNNKPADEGQGQRAKTSHVSASRESPSVTSALSSHRGGVASALPIKIGFLLDRERVSLQAAGKLGEFRSEIASAFPVVSVNQDQIDEALAISDCLKNKDLLCIAGTLSLFPGVQMLVLIERFDTPTQFPGSTVVKMAVIDTGIPFRYPAMEVAATVQSEGELDRFVKGVLGKLFETAVAKSAVMPWFCRTFSSEENRWYVSAGQLSGLMIGQQLKIVSGGKVVRAPGGLPAGWLPGKEVGRLKVDLFFGKDLAVCSLMEGRGPQPEDLILVR